MSNRKIVCALTLAVMAMWGSVAGQSQPQTGGATKQTAKNGPNQVQTVGLRQYPGEIMQGRFSKTVWQSEVKKMVASYGAPISEADQALIVEYLVAVKGLEAPAAAP